MSTAIYNKTAGDLIRDALRDASIVAVGIPITGEDFTIGSNTLNDVLSFWQAKSGINLWRETQALLPLNPNQSDYILGVDGDHCFTDYAYMETSSAVSGGQLVIPVVSNIPVSTSPGQQGFGVGDMIGIEMANGYRHWTTISSVSIILPPTVTIAQPLAFDVNISASIYVHRVNIDRPIRILDSQTAIGRANEETPVLQISRQEYYNIPNKTDASDNVNQWYYSPQLNNGELSIWPPSKGKACILRFTFVKPQYIPEDQSEDILIPPEFYLPLKWAVASELGVTYAIDPNRLVAIETKARSSLEDALSNDVENDYFSVQPG